VRSDAGYIVAALQLKAKPTPSQVSARESTHPAGSAKQGNSKRKEKWGRKIEKREEEHKNRVSGGREEALHSSVITQPGKVSSYLPSILQLNSSGKARSWVLRLAMDSCSYKLELLVGDSKGSAFCAHLFFQFLRFSSRVNGCPFRFLVNKHGEG
jgi:hypothetical protein